MRVLQEVYEIDEYLATLYHQRFFLVYQHIIKNAISENTFNKLSANNFCKIEECLYEEQKAWNKILMQKKSLVKLVNSLERNMNFSVALNLYTPILNPWVRIYYRLKMFLFEERAIAFQKKNASSFRERSILYDTIVEYAFFKEMLENPYYMEEPQILLYRNISFILPNTKMINEDFFSEKFEERVITSMNLSLPEYGRYKKIKIQEFLMELLDSLKELSHQDFFTIITGGEFLSFICVCRNNMEETEMVEKQEKTITDPYKKKYLLKLIHMLPVKDNPPPKPQIKRIK